MSYHLYYAGYNQHTEEEQIGVAHSVDGLCWEYKNKNPIIPLSSQGAQDESQTSNPCVIKHQGVYKMWYQGKSKEGALSVCFAQSTDGIEWIADSVPVLSLASEAGVSYRDGYHHPHVVFDEDKKIFKMWFVSCVEERTSVMYTESVDGMSWGAPCATGIISPKDSIKYWYPYVMKDDGVYKIWITRRDEGGVWSIMYNTSPDGVLWDMNLCRDVINIKYPRYISFMCEVFAKYLHVYAPFPLYGVASPFVWKEKGKYHLVGHEVCVRGKLRIARYVSPDGITWNRVTGNILKKPDTSWNIFFQADPYIYVEE